METPDPAWFYSSLAQASAAIVGLIGAVLGARIVDHVALMRQLRRELDSELARLASEINDEPDRWSGYCNYLEREAVEDRAAIQRGETSRILGAVQEWNKMVPTPSEPVDCRKHLAQIETTLRTLHVIRTAYVRLQGQINDSDILSFASHLRLVAAQVPEEPAQYLLGNARVLDYVLDTIRHFRSRLLPSAFVVVTIILTWLALTGVLWPLSALPSYDSSFYSKTLLLSALAIGLMGLIGWFVYQFIELKRLGNVAWEPKK